MNLNGRELRLIKTALKYFRQEESLMDEMEALSKRFDVRPLIGRGSRPTRRDEVVECLVNAGEGGTTAKEVSREIGITPTQAGIYLSHLVATGVAYRMRRVDGHRKNAYVYYLVEK